MDLLDRQTIEIRSSPAPFRSTPEEDGGRKTTADVLEGFAPGSRKGGEGERNTTAGVLEGFARGARVRGGENSTPPLSPFS